MQQSKQESSASVPHSSKGRSGWPIIVTAVLAIAVGAGGMYAFRSWIRPAARGRAGEASKTESNQTKQLEKAAGLNTLSLSDQARKNIGLKLGTVMRQLYERKATMPAVVVERPARTKIDVVAPLSGVITKIHASPGEALDPDRKLFDLRLMHEELVQAQATFLRIAGELDVVQKEIDRLEPASKRGVIAGKTLLERQYEKSKLLAVQRAQRQALLLHRLSESDVDAILKNRELKSGLTVTMGGSRERGSGVEGRESREKDETLRANLVLQRLDVHTGEHVDAGQRLCVLADYSELLIEGLAFEQDVGSLHAAIRNGWKVTAVLQQNQQSADRITDLSILYVSGEIEHDSRTLRFYVELPNRQVSTPQNSQTPRYIDWHYKPGQRLSLEVPVERWSNSFVLPVEAVIREGAESYVFQQDGDRFLRVPVHERFRDRNSVVIADDGSLFESDVVAFSGAYQMQLALKNTVTPVVSAHGHPHN